jgi:enoyl-CoA hydratase
LVTDFVTIEKGLGPDGRIAVVRFDRADGVNARGSLTQPRRAG